MGEGIGGKEVKKEMVSGREWKGNGKKKLQKMHKETTKREKRGCNGGNRHKRTERLEMIREKGLQGLRKF